MYYQPDVQDFKPMKEKPNPKIVAVAIIEKDGNILIGKRKRGKCHVGVWEFPGGTVEDGETSRTLPFTGITGRV